jgi:hypothetical protein
VIVKLAAYTLARIARLGGPRADVDAAQLVVDRHELGRGYGRITTRADSAMATLAGPAMPRLDGVYSGKAAAALLRLHRERVEPLVFWATKSTTTLARPAAQALEQAPRALARWLTS